MSNAFVFILLACLATVSTSSAQVIAPDFELTASDMVQNGGFGVSLAINDGFILVGSSSDSSNGFAAGSTYLFDKTTRVQLRKFVASDAGIVDGFGASVGLSSTTAYVGSPYHDIPINNAGAVYAFDAMTGIPLFKLGPNASSSNALFGSSIQTHNNILAVGAHRDPTNGINSGLVYLFDADTGVKIRTIQPDDAQSEMLFGKSIALTDNYIFVGASSDDEAGPDSGAVYVFDYSGNQLDKILSVSKTQNAGFGFAIDADESLLFVGAPSAEPNGACYLFDVNTRKLLHTLAPEPPNNIRSFGIAVLLSGDYIAVGGRPVQSLSSHVSLYGSSSGMYLARLVNSINPASVEFGHALAADTQYIYSGDNLADSVGVNAGAISGYRYNCHADFDNNYVLDFFDVSGFINAYMNEDPAADFTADGTLNFFDVSAFIESFLAGCP